MKVSERLGCTGRQGVEISTPKSFLGRSWSAHARQRGQQDNHKQGQSRTPEKGSSGRSHLCTCLPSRAGLATVISYTSPFFFRPIYYLRPSCSLPLPRVVTQIRGHIAGSSPPIPTTVRALHFYRGNISALSSLVDSRRIVRTHARRSQQLILFFYFFLRINSKSRHGGIRTHGQH